MLTVYKDTKMIFQALKAGACGYVLKRSRAGGNSGCHRRGAGGGAPMTSEIARMVVRSFQGDAGPHERRYRVGCPRASLEILGCWPKGCPTRKSASPDHQRRHGAHAT